MRCIHCPTPENTRCAGLDVRRYCALIDPKCAHFSPGYREVIVHESLLRRDEFSTRLADDRQMEIRAPISDEAERIAISTDCCGGAIPPGIFDDIGDG